MPKFRAAGSDRFVNLEPHSLHLADYDVICAASTAGKSTLSQVFPDLCLDIDPVIDLLFTWDFLNSEKLQGESTRFLRDRCFNTAYLLAQLLACGDLTDADGRWKRKLLDFDVRPSFTWPGGKRPRLLFVELTPVRLLDGWRIRHAAGEPWGLHSLKEAKRRCSERMDAINHFYPDCDVAMLWVNQVGKNSYPEHLVDLFSEVQSGKVPVDPSGRARSTYSSMPRLMSELMKSCNVPFPFPSPTRKKGKK